MMKIIKRVLIYTFSTILFSILVLFGLIWIYKDELRDLVYQEIKSHLVADVKVEEVNFSAFDHFPDITVELKGISIDKTVKKDSVKLLTLEKLQVVVDTYRLITGEYEVKKVLLSNGSLDMHTDSTGVSDFKILRPKAQKDTSKIQLEMAVKLISFRDFKLHFQNDYKKMHLSLFIKHMKANVAIDTNKISGKLSGTFDSEQVTFRPGTFLANKIFHLDVDWRFLKHEKQLQFLASKLITDGDIYHITGGIDFPKEQTLTLKIKSKKANLLRTLRLLPEKFHRRFKKFESSGNFLIEGLVQTSLLPHHRPIVNASCVAQNIVIKKKGTPFEISKLNFKADFTIGDSGIAESAQLAIRGVKGMIAGEPFNAEIRLDNFKTPLLDLQLHSNIDFSKLDSDLIDDRFDYMRGKLKLDLNFKGEIAYFYEPDITDRPFVEGSALFTDAAFKLKKVDFPISHVSGSLNLADHVTKVNAFKICTGKSFFELNGFCTHLLASVVSKDIPFVVNAAVSSDMVEMRDFMHLSDQPKAIPVQKKVKLDTKIQKLSKTVLHALPDGVDFTFKGNFKKIVYHHFEAFNAETSLRLNNQVLNFTQKAEALEGRMLFTINMDASNDSWSKVNINANIKGVNIKKMFYAFENFKQEVLTTDNITGKVDLRMEMHYALSNQSHLDTNSLYSVVDFKIKGVELKHFEPLTKMSNILLKNRDLEHVQIEDLENRITLEGTTLHIPEMAVVSNVLFFYGGGTFNFTTQTLNAQCFVPLRNLKKHFKPDDTSVDAKRGVCIPVAISGKAKSLSVKMVNNTN